MIPIDRNIPQPRAKTGKRKYPWPEMKEGDSFFVPGKKAKELTGVAMDWVKHNDLNWIFRSSTVVEDGVEGARIWRIKPRPTVVSLAMRKWK